MYKSEKESQSKNVPGMLREEISLMTPFFKMTPFSLHGPTDRSPNMRRQSHQHIPLLSGIRKNQPTFLATRRAYRKGI